MKILTLFTDGFEETEGLAVVDILRRAQIDVVVASVSGDIFVKGSHNIIIKADVLLKDVDLLEFGGVFLPGGPGVKSLKENKNVIDIVRSFYESGKFISAICAAPSILHKAGIMADKKYTIFPSSGDDLKGGILVDEPVVVDGRIITAKAMGASIEFGLKMVELFCGIEKRNSIKNSIYYK